MIKGYHTDNGIFNASEFTEELFKKQQNIRFSGAGASYQNVAVERAIKTVFTTVRTMLMHAALRCPEATLYTYLRPMEMDYSELVYSQIPNMHSGLSGIEILSRSRFEPVSETLSNYHFWGCPTYVLEPTFHNPRVKIPKWDPRSRIGVNMGFNKMHSTESGLVLKLLTGSISPQYHVVFDEMFSTVTNSTAAYPEVWIRLLTSRNSRIQVMLDQEDDPELDYEWLTADDQLTRFRKSK